MNRKVSSFHADCSTCTSRNKSVFCNLNTTELAHFDDHKTCVVYKKGQTIFHENGHPLGIYCVNAGTIKITRNGYDGREQIVRLITNGGILGYRAMFSGTRYNANAIAIEDSNVCFIPRDTFFNVLNSNCSLSHELIKMISLELGKAEQNITDIAQKTVRARVAETLMLLRDTYGLEDDKETIDISLSREDIACLVGTATETLIRLLSAYKREGTIELKGKKIKIINVQKLAQAANSH